MTEGLEDIKDLWYMVAIEETREPYEATVFGTNELEVLERGLRTQVRNLWQGEVTFEWDIRLKLSVQNLREATKVKLVRNTNTIHSKVEKSRIASVSMNVVLTVDSLECFK
jgi:hypothetical protein